MFQRKPKRDFSVIYSELLRKHELNFSAWEVLDTKIGILLGLIVLVLLEVTVNTDIVSSLTTNVRVISLFSESLIWGTNLIGFVLFWVAFGLFVAATYVGIQAYYAKRFDDIQTIEEIDMFLADSKMTNEMFIERTGRVLYAYVEVNEKRAYQKSHAIKMMIKLFSFGIASFIARFIIIVLSSSLR
jgi:hypothetical protein